MLWYFADKATDMSIKYTVRYGTVLTLVKDDPLFLQRTVLYGTAGICTSTYRVELWERNQRYMYNVYNKMKQLGDIIA